MQSVPVCITFTCWSDEDRAETSAAVTSSRCGFRLTTPSAPPRDRMRWSWLIVLMRAAMPSSISRTSAGLSISCFFFTETDCIRTMLTRRVRLLAMR